MTTGSEIGVMWPQAKESLEPSEAGGVEGQTLPWSPGRERSLAKTLIFVF